jgi:hypothetical protein
MERNVLNKIIYQHFNQIFILVWKVTRSELYLYRLGIWMHMVSVYVWKNVGSIYSYVVMYKYTWVCCIVSMYICTYLCIQSVPGGKSIFWEVIVLFILSKNMYMYMCLLPVSEIELFNCTVHCTLYRRATRHVLTRAAKRINADGWIFKNVLY